MAHNSFKKLIPPFRQLGIDSSRKLCTFPSMNGMKIWKYQEFNGINGVQFASSNIPYIQRPTDVLVKVSASSVNPLDTAMLDGYGDVVLNILRKFDSLHRGDFNMEKSDFSSAVGRDFVGRVVSVGHGVKHVKPNDKVWGVVSPHRSGAHAEYVVTDDCKVDIKPSTLSDAEASSIPYVGLTGWSSAVVTGGLKPRACHNKKVLVLGASGGVGTFLCQLLSTWGAQVTGVCSEEAFEIALSNGASEVYDYKNPDTINLLTSQPRFDVILDAAGTCNLSWMEGLKEWTGASYVSLVSPLLKNTDQFGIVQGGLKTALKLFESNSSISRGRLCKWAYFMPNRKALTEIGKMVNQGNIRPVIDKVFNFDETKSAYEHMKNGPARGKTVINFCSDPS